MPPSPIIPRRLHNQHITQPTFKTPLEVVSWMGAVQAQDYPAAKWAVGLRMQTATDAMLDQALADGSIIRTHVLRPTWHFVAPVDARWMLELTAPRVIALMAYNQRQLGLDKAVFSRTHKVLTKALQGGHYLTRAELSSVLKQAGVDNTEARVAYITGQAELDRVICSGPRQGKQFTYALFDERVPAARPKPHAEALAELALRYFTSHGPATLQDYAWWSGLNLSDARDGLEMAKSKLVSDEIDGQTYWLSASTTPTSAEAPTVYLLPNYDEYIVGYTDRTAIYDGSHDHKLDARGNVLFNHTMISNGQIVGTWKRTLKRESVVVELIPFIPLTKTEHKAFAAEAERYAKFLGLPLVLS